MKARLVSILFALLALPLARLGADERALTFFVAASTNDLATEAASAYSRRTGITVKVVPASSGSLARQIAAGAPADLFLSASTKWSDWLREQNGVLPESIRELMRNQLVVIAGQEAAAPTIRFSADYAFADAFKGRLSIGDPAHVPAGRYAADALAFYGWDKALHDRLLPAQDVRAAMVMVELGQCDLGIVYATDAMLSRKVRTVAVFPEVSHAPVVYTINICRDSRSPADAKAFWEYLRGKEVEDMIRRYGFSTRADGKE
jgi:molybdate transport system substrate-binding protein